MIIQRPPPAFSRRQIIGGAVALAAGSATVARATSMFVTAPALNPMLLERARASMDRHAGNISNRDQLALIDFSLPSRDSRLIILNLASGQGVAMLVAHGRGSDPNHCGWLESFSNDYGSGATSSGAYVTAARYNGVHGDSQRLVGLDADNCNAEARAIVIHPADYVSADVIAMQGKLGRSEGCFALCPDDSAMALSLLGEGTLIYADRV